jgi:hypothetical protein
MYSTINFSVEDLTRDLAEQYAKGLLSMDEYINLLKEIATPAMP